MTTLPGRLFGDSGRWVAAHFPRPEADRTRPHWARLGPTQRFPSFRDHFWRAPSPSAFIDDPATPTDRAAHVQPTRTYLHPSPHERRICHVDGCEIGPPLPAERKYAVAARACSWASGARNYPNERPRAASSGQSGPVIKCLRTSRVLLPPRTGLQHGPTSY